MCVMLTVNYLYTEQEDTLSVRNPVKEVNWRGRKKVVGDELVQGGQYLLLTQLSNLQHSVMRPVLGLHMEGLKVCV